jgi:recombination protein RecA
VNEKVSKDNSKQEMLKAVFSQIDKLYGKGSIMLLGQSTAAQVDTISSGSLLLDQAIGIGGYPRGRIIEIFGPEASGKTTLALQVVAQAQKNGGICAFIDAEHALDPVYAQKLGININDLIISQPDCGEHGLDIAEMLIRSGVIDVIVIDSVAALVPRVEIEGDIGDTHMGLQARLMSQALRILTPLVHKSKTVLIFINQIRHNLNAMPFANKEVTPGGNALKFYASVRLDIRRVEGLKDKDGGQRGNVVKIKVAKNKMAPPFKVIKLELIFGEGINRESELIDLAIAYNIITQSGSWFSLDGEKIAQGRDQLGQLLKNQESTKNLINSRVQEALAQGAVASLDKNMQDE